MTTDPTDRPPGRRHNGLPAQSFSSAGDVDPRVGQHLLDVLYLSGIAAYLQPTVDYGAVTQAAVLPSQPTDRLWVDRVRVEEARGLVAAEAAAAGRTLARPVVPRRTDDEAVWADIVASFDRELTSAVPPWPVHEDLDEPVDRPPTTAQEPFSTAEEQPDEGPEPEEGYVPPPPPPLPRVSKGTAGAVAAIAFGLLMLIAPGLLSLDSDVGLTIGILSVVAGVCYLIWHMHDSPSADDRPDDGAVV